MLLKNRHIAAAVAAASLCLAATAPAQALSFFQNYNVSSAYDISSIALYQTGPLSGGQGTYAGLTNSFQVFAPQTLITDPFVKENPIQFTFLLGVSGLEPPLQALSLEEPSPQHLVVAFNDAFAATALGAEFGDLFAGYDEQDLIAALQLIDTPDLPEGDPGRADQQGAKNDAISLLFDFSGAVVNHDAAFGSNDVFTLVAFSSGAPAGEGQSFTTAAISAPEPATWGLMLAGFGLAGALLRRRRDAAHSFG